MKQKVQLKLQFLVTVAITLVFGFVGANLSWAGNGNKVVPGELLIQSKAGVSKGKIDKLLKSHGAGTAGEIEKIKVRKIKVPAHALEKVKQALAKKPQYQFRGKELHCRGGL